MKTLLSFLLIILSLSSYAYDLKEIEQWEAKILKEVKQYEESKPEKVYWVYLTAGREFNAFGLKVKAAHYYEEALRINPKNEELIEIYVELINLHRDNKERSLVYIQKLEEKLASAPASEVDKLQDWVKVMRARAEGKTTKNPPPFMAQWVKDQDTVLLIKEGKFKEAFALQSSNGLEESDINRKIQYDILSILVVGKHTPRLYCAPSLEKYSNSTTWSMRICRYLTAWKKGVKGEESITSIEAQLKEEDPKRLYYADALRKL
jgi:hypothetical protein